VNVKAIDPAPGVGLGKVTRPAHEGPRSARTAQPNSPFR
jgi:hypothetical protein